MMTINLYNHCKTDLLLQRVWCPLPGGNHPGHAGQCPPRCLPSQPSYHCLNWIRTNLWVYEYIIMFIYWLYVLFHYKYCVTDKTMSNFNTIIDFDKRVLS